MWYASIIVLHIFGDTSPEATTTLSTTMTGNAKGAIHHHHHQPSLPLALKHTVEPHTHTHTHLRLQMKGNNILRYGLLFYCFYTLISAILFTLHFSKWCVCVGAVFSQIYRFSNGFAHSIIQVHLDFAHSIYIYIVRVCGGGG